MERDIFKSQLVPMALFAALCAMSGHVGHERSPWNKGWFCMDPDKRAQLIGNG